MDENPRRTREQSSLYGRGLVRGVRQLGNSDFSSQLQPKNQTTTEVLGRPIRMACSACRPKQTGQGRSHCQNHQGPIFLQPSPRLPLYITNTRSFLGSAWARYREWVHTLSSCGGGHWRSLIQSLLRATPSWQGCGPWTKRDKPYVLE